MKPYLLMIMFTSTTGLLLRRQTLINAPLRQYYSLNASSRCYFCSTHLQSVRLVSSQVHQRIIYRVLSMSSANVSEGDTMKPSDLSNSSQNKQSIKDYPKDETSDADSYYLDENYDESFDHEDVDDLGLLSTTPTNYEDKTTTISLPPGVSKDYHIVRHATIPPHGFSTEKLSSKLKDEEISRLEMSPCNVTTPVALMMMFPEYETLTRARKECRRKKVVILRGNRADERGEIIFDLNRMLIGRVGDRVHPGDTIAIQTRANTGGYTEPMKHNKDPPFYLPVVYQDDHMAIVNKPEGVVVFGHKNGGYGRHTVKATLPYVLDPPTTGTLSVLWNPMPVHRIDKATSGLLVVAKTRAAMVHLAGQFKERKVKKTYTAIINGIPPEPKETSLTSTEAKSLGVCVEQATNSFDEINGSGSSDPLWQIIDKDLEGQTALTIWRALGRSPLENARNDTATVVELKPKTGRFHQLRRHMAWVCQTPILGDKAYDGAGPAKLLRDRGLFLCSNKVTLEHPYYNTPDGRLHWEVDALAGKRVEGDNRVSLTEENDGTVLLNVEIPLPSKFNSMMQD